MNKKNTYLAVAGIIAALAFGGAAIAKSKKVDLDSDKAKLGYTIGAQIGRDLKQGQMAEEIDVDALTAAIKDLIAGNEAQMTDDEMVAAQQAFQAKKQAEYQAIADGNAAKSAEYLEKNKTADGVVSTDSGLQYVVVTEGAGKTPTTTDTVKVHYQGTKIDGTVFDSSYDRGQPVEFPVNGVIPGFSEGLLLMKEGGKLRLTIPAELAYGANAPETIGPNQALIFDLELIEVISASDPEPEVTE